MREKNQLSLVDFGCDRVVFPVTTKASQRLSHTIGAEPIIHVFIAGKTKGIYGRPKISIVGERPQFDQTV